MTNKHLNDAEIQQYVLQITNCDVDIIEHVQHCTNCKIKAEQYRFLFDGIREQEKPVFDFNLAELVMEQLPKCQQKVSNETPLFYSIVSIVIFFVCIFFYLFGNNLLTLFEGITPVLIGLIITTVTSILVFLCIDMYKKHQAQMKALNFN
ncbi:MAG: hypothetical protein IT249_08820 [Chitinophagaceae bacterium]|nr:hypothetical protein [Chitinophagaceae bacterium]